MNQRALLGGRESRRVSVRYFLPLLCLGSMEKGDKNNYCIENRPKWLTKKLKIYLQKMEKLKIRGVQPPMNQERKKPNLINVIYHVYQRSLSPFLYN